MTELLHWRPGKTATALIMGFANQCNEAQKPGKPSKTHHRNPLAPEYSGYVDLGWPSACSFNTGGYNEGLEAAAMGPLKAQEA